MSIQQQLRRFVAVALSMLTFGLAAEWFVRQHLIEATAPPARSCRTTVPSPAVGAEAGEVLERGRLLPDLLVATV